MKKGFFGYNVSEVDVMMNALREENESLNAIITTLKTQIKNSESGSAKANLLEANLKSSEENLKQISEEKNELITQITTLSMESKDFNRQNAELMTQIEHLHMQNGDLNRQISEFHQQIVDLTDLADNADTSLMEALQSQLDSEKENKLSLEQALNDKVEELAAATNALEETKSKLEILIDDLHKERAQMSVFTSDYQSTKEEQVSTKAALENVTGELEKAQKEIDQLQGELDIAKTAVDELAKIKAIEKKQQANLNQASVISSRAYYEMTKMRNEVVEYMHEQMQEYYQFVNENSVKMSTVIEQRQLEYNQMIRDFFTKVSEFRVSLSSIENKYSNMADYSMSIDKVSDNLDEIMSNFIRESNAYLKKNEEAYLDEEIYGEEKASRALVEDVLAKPLSIEDFRAIKSEG